MMKSSLNSIEREIAKLKDKAIVKGGKNAVAFWDGEVLRIQMWTGRQGKAGSNYTSYLMETKDPEGVLQKLGLNQYLLFDESGMIDEYEH